MLVSWCVMVFFLRSENTTKQMTAHRCKVYWILVILNKHEDWVKGEYVVTSDVTDHNRMPYEAVYSYNSLNKIESFQHLLYLLYIILVTIATTHSEQ